MRTKLLTLLLFALLTSGLAACGSDDDDNDNEAAAITAAAATPEPATTTSAETDTAPAGDCKSVGAPVPKADGGGEPPKDELDPDTTYSLVVKTNCGSFTIELDQTLAPETSASLV